MVEIIKPGTKFNFLGRRKQYYVISAVLITLSLGAMGVRTVTNGTPRQNSIKVTHSTRIAGMCERRPRASMMPSGKAPLMPTAAITRVSIKPPHWLVATSLKPRKPPCSNQ